MPVGWASGPCLTVCDLLVHSHGPPGPSFDGLFWYGDVCRKVLPSLIGERSQPHHGTCRPQRFSPASSGSRSSLITELVDIPPGSGTFQREAHRAINRRGSLADRAGSFAGVRNSPEKGFWHFGPSTGGVSYVSLTSPVPRGQWVSCEPSSDYGADLRSCLPATTTLSLGQWESLGFSLACLCPVNCPCALFSSSLSWAAGSLWFLLGMFVPCELPRALDNRSCTLHFMSPRPCTSRSPRLLSSCSSSTLSSSCSFCSCPRHDLCMPPEFRIQLAAAFCRSIKRRRWKVLVAPAPPPSSAPHPAARGEGPGSWGAAGALLSRAAGWGAGKKGGRGGTRRFFLS